MEELKKYYAQHLIKFMLKLELAETDKHSIKILLRRKNLRFLRRTNLIKTRCGLYSHRKPAEKLQYNTKKLKQKI